MLENKLGIKSSVELANEEERITKIKALELFDKNKINEFEIGTFRGLSMIHKYLFDDIYSFAGKVRTENIAKGNFRFASVMYLEDARTLEEVPYPINLDVTEIFCKDERYADSLDYIYIEKNTIDLHDIIWEHVMLEKPMRVVK